MGMATREMANEWVGEGIEREIEAEEENEAFYAPNFLFVPHSKQMNNCWGIKVQFFPEFGCWIGVFLVPSVLLASVSSYTTNQYPIRKLN